MLNPSDLLPACHALAAGIFFAGAFLLGFIAQRAHNLARVAFYSLLSALFTLGGAALAFGNLLAFVTTR
jgi:hypothetical protein